MTVRLQIVGGGKMGEALVGGLVAAGWARVDELRVVEVDPQRRRVLADAFDRLQVEATPVEGADALVAVKPDAVEAVIRRLCELDVGRVLSIAAGVTTARIEAAGDPELRVVRAMPNTPALVGVGMAAIAGGSAAGTADLDWAAAILGAVGEVVRVDEAQLDAVTGLSGSGPAYAFLLAEALIAAGVGQGLSPDTSRLLTEQTLLGAATLLRRSEQSAATLRADVTSPGGTTAAGLAVFERYGFIGIVDEVVAAATARSIELGTSDG